VGAHEQQAEHGETCQHPGGCSPGTRDVSLERFDRFPELMAPPEASRLVLLSGLHLQDLACEKHQGVHVVLRRSRQMSLDGRRHGAGFDIGRKKYLPKAPRRRKSSAPVPRHASIVDFAIPRTTRDGAADPAAGGARR
jgi:hypothetical protein